MEYIIRLFLTNIHQAVLDLNLIILLCNGTFKISKNDLEFF